MLTVVLRKQHVVVLTALKAVQDAVLTALKAVQDAEKKITPTKTKYKDLFPSIYISSNFNVTEVAGLET
jgi:hypothetical protein